MLQRGTASPPHKEQSKTQEAWAALMDQAGGLLCFTQSPARFEVVLKFVVWSPVGLKQSSCSVSVITPRNQQLPSPGAGPCRTAAPQQGLEHEAWLAVSLSWHLLTLLHCLLINKLNILIAFEHKACAQLNMTELFVLPLSPPNVLLGKLVGKKVSRYQQFSGLELQNVPAQVNSRTGKETSS